MKSRKHIFAIVGSASQRSSNHALVDLFVQLTSNDFEVTVYSDLKTLPHFDPGLSTDQPPPSVVHFREQIEKADGILICTPEYVFSIPSGLKNAIEWCVATTVFSDKPAALITASAHGQKGHEELQLILRTVMAQFTAGTTLLIQGIKGKVNEQGAIADAKTIGELEKLIEAFKNLLSTVAG